MRNVLDFVEKSEGKNWLKDGLNIIDFLKILKNVDSIVSRLVCVSRM